MRKRFGQHFLRDKQVIHAILDLLSPDQDDYLVEIGPGDGALTVPILRCTGRLVAIELDRELILALKQRTATLGELTLYAEDVLSFDFMRLQRQGKKLRIVGNLPYNISTPLIFHLLTFSPLIQDMLFMLQKEVADRITACPGSKLYGRLSVMVQYRCHVESLLKIKPDAFHVPPQVESSLVKLIPYTVYPVVAIDQTVFADIVTCAFNQRRKSLRNSLRQRVPEDIWPRVEIASSLRAEELTVRDFVKLANAVATWP